MSGLLPYVPLVALLVSLGFNVYQYYDRQRAWRPRVVVSANDPVGAPSWPDRREGMFTGDDTGALYLAGTIHVAGSAIITDARLAPASGDAAWNALPVPDIYVGEPANPDSGRREGGMGIAQIPDEEHLHRLPQPLTDAQLVIRLELPPARLGMRLDDWAQLWVETDTGHRFRSEPGTLRQRYRGLPEGARERAGGSNKPPFAPEPEADRPPHEK